MAYTIYIDLDGTGAWFVIKCPYSRLYVEDLKEQIGFRDRRWVPEQRSWCVARTQWALAEELLRKHYGYDARFVVGPAAQAAIAKGGSAPLEAEDRGNAPETDDYRRLGIQSDAPECVLHAAYLALEASYAGGYGVQHRDRGIAPPVETRKSYRRVCAHRSIRPQPAAVISAAVAAAIDAGYRPGDDE